MDYLTMDENVCPVCGKVFYTALGREWGWSYKGNHYCSYHCMRHVEVRHRVRQGWAKNNWQNTTYPVGKDAQKIAADMRSLRHLAKAADHLAKAAAEQEGAMKVDLALLGEKTDEMGQRLWSKHSTAIDKLDTAKQKLVYDLFCDAKPLWQVAADRNIDTDLLGVKLCVTYEAMARGEQ